MLDQMIFIIRGMKNPGKLGRLLGEVAQRLAELNPGEDASSILRKTADELERHGA